MQNSLRKLGSAQETGETLSHSQRRTGAPCPSTVTTAQDESAWHEFHYLFCLSDSNSYHVNLSLLLLRLLYPYQEESLFIKSEKRQTHELHLASWLRKRKYIHKFFELQPILEKKSEY